jgi:hypothetical protein
VSHNVIEGDTGNEIRCFTGTVALRDTGLIGATVGTLTTSRGFTIQIRQVPGPDNTGIPLTDANGRFVTICGNFITDVSGTVFNVTFVRFSRLFS